ncbi:MAG: OmpH family outer membrane protein [Rubrivivax sp.]|nr:OmpH family outer membrane protein [Rubrivivax sp.]
MGVVDLRQAFQRSPLAMTLTVGIGAEFEGRRRELRRRLIELGKLRDRAQRAEGQERTELEERIWQESRSAAEAQSAYRRDLEAAQKRLGDELLAHVSEVAAEVARERGLTLLVKTEGVLWTRSPAVVPIDITEDVARALLQRAERPAAAPATRQ